ncbi:substrate-binding domain-containing protein [soil metagenome]
MARLLDVARAAGVSRSTVSNVFSRPERVSPEIRRRVEAAAERLGYGGPDPTGRALRGGKVNAIGFLPGLSLEGSFHWPYFIEFLAGVAGECGARHAGLLLLSGIDEEAATRGVSGSLVDGFILHNAGYVDQLIALASKRRTPFVAVDMAAPPSITSIRIDNKGGGRQSVEHALALGHRKFAILSLALPERERRSPVYHAPMVRPRRLAETFPDTLERYAGYADALAAAGIAIDAVPVVEALPDSTEGAALLLDRAPEATMVLAMADDLALSVYAEAGKRGRSVPRDLSVIGFDDVPAAAAAAPPLTTIAQPTREKGRMAAQMIFEPPAEPLHIVMPVHLVVRGSTAPPAR